MDGNQFNRFTSHNPPEVSKSKICSTWQTLQPEGSIGSPDCVLYLSCSSSVYQLRLFTSVWLQNICSWQDSIMDYRLASVLSALPILLMKTSENSGGVIRKTILSGDTIIQIVPRGPGYQIIWAISIIDRVHNQSELGASLTDRGSSQLMRIFMASRTSNIVRQRHHRFLYKHVRLD